MKQLLTSRYLYRALRLIMGALFIVAGALKLSDPSAFALTINIYGLVSWKLSTILSYVIPIVEIITGSALVLDIKGSLGLIVAYLLGFMILLSYAVYMGIDADCGCFGRPRDTSSDPVGPMEAFVRDAIMLAGCGFMYWQRKVAGFTPKPLSRLFMRRG